MRRGEALDVFVIIAAAIAGLFAWSRRVHQNHVRVALTVAGLVVAVPGLVTPLDWSRYYLLPAVFASLQMALGLAWTARAVRDSAAGIRWRTR